MVRVMVARLVAALACERGFLAAVSTVGEVGGGLIGAIGGLFGGGAPKIQFGGVEICANNPVDVNQLVAAWRNAPQSARDRLWGQVRGLGQGFIIVDFPPNPPDDTKVGLIAWAANGGKDCKHDSLDSQARSFAQSFIATYAAGGPGVAVTPAPTTGPTTGERIDNIIETIAGPGPTPTGAAGGAPVTAAGFDLDNPIMLAIVGGLVFFMVRGAK